MKRLTTQEFIIKARAIHGDKYDYSKVVYINSKTKVCIICPEHGEFWQIPGSHLRKHGCLSCGNRAYNGNARADSVRRNRPDLSHIETPKGSKAVPVGAKGDYTLVDEEDYERVMQYNWSLHKRGYAYNIKVGNLHRFIMNPPDDKVVDHIFHNKLDNRKSQLRVCTQKQNILNQKPRKGTSKFKGVSWHTASGKWASAIQLNKKYIRLGLFDDEIEAAKVYDEAAKKYHKDFARLNFRSY